MATKLKNMRLTSVDLVRAGANQEADICLFKSADTETPPEATGSPTEPEKNILKRFIAWLEKNPTEAENEPHSPQDTPVEKEYSTFREVEDEMSYEDRMWRYSDALAESIVSIFHDEDLSDEEKFRMMKQSLGEFDEAMVGFFEALLDRAAEGGVEKEYEEIEEVAGN